MPTYDYSCSKCEHSFDKILRVDDRAEPTKDACPNCGAKNTVSIMLTAPSLMNANRVDGLIKPHPQFKERMQQIKKGLPEKYKKNIKDY
jgi:putative FmdB family regulatory protein